ncbi:MAG: hypothetical protein NC818_00140 [Candidatus Omnitrophica bacterium]|nr:hypothetical protein [Candidatus Omnitrophota bacterium]
MVKEVSNKYVEIKRGLSRLEKSKLGLFFLSLSFVYSLFIFTINFDFDKVNITRRIKSPLLDLASLRDGTDFFPFMLWEGKFTEIVSRKEVAKERVAIYICRGEGRVLKFLVEVPQVEALSKDDFETVSNYVALKIYHALTLFGGESLVINGSPKLYESVKDRILNSLSKQGMDIGSFLKMVREIDSFDINRYANLEDTEKTQLERLAKPIESLFDCEEDSRIAIIPRSEMQGTVIGLDFGGSDIKISVLINGDSKFEKKLKWDSSHFSSLEEHKRYAKALLNFARYYVSLEAVKSKYSELFKEFREAKERYEISPAELEDLVELAKSLGIKPLEVKGLGISIACAVHNGRITGPAPMVGGLNINDPTIKEEVAEFGFWIGEKLLGLQRERIKIINDGDAGAVYSSANLGLRNVLTWSLGTGLATGYVDRNGRIATDLLTEGGNIVLDMSQFYRDDPIGHSVTGVPGALQQYLSQRPVVRMVIEKGIIDITNPEFRNQRGDIDQRKILIRIQEMYSDPAVDNIVKNQIKEIFETIGVYLAHAVAQVQPLLGIENLIIFGQVVVGEFGRIVKEKAEEVLREQYPQLKITIHSVENPDFAQAIGAGYLGYSP